MTDRDDDFVAWFDEQLSPPDENGCRHWTKSRNHNGYGQVWFAGATRKAHRVAFALANGGIEPSLLVRHRCDVRTCCEPGHLLQGTNAENKLDAMERDRLNVFKREDIIQIFRLRAEGLTQMEIAQKIGCSQRTVCLILTGRMQSIQVASVCAECGFATEPVRAKKQTPIGTTRYNPRDVVAMVESGLTQCEVARRLGIARYTVHSVLNGRIHGSLTVDLRGVE